MQDKQTGNMVQLEANNQEAYDKAIPDRSRQGITLSVGEVISVKGADFKVQSIGDRFVVIQGLPGVRF